MKLWLARHAQPLIEPGICYGATDVSADAQATLHAARALAQVLPIGLAVASSPLQRCEQLTQCLLALRPDLASRTDVRLQEMNFGAWEGQRWDAIDPAELQRWTDHFGTWRCGGAESVQEVMVRVSTAWDEACAAQQPTIWITHAGVIRIATLLAGGTRHIERADQWPREGIAFGAHGVLSLLPNGDGSHQKLTKPT